MLRFARIAVVLTAACHGSVTTTQRTQDAAPDQGVWPDAPPPPPPTIDAGPAPHESCGHGVSCALPASTCLDDYYLLYYTGGGCVDGACQLRTNTLYCPAHCFDGGCLGGFT